MNDHLRSSPSPPAFDGRQSWRTPPQSAQSAPIDRSATTTTATTTGWRRQAATTTATTSPSSEQQLGIPALAPAASVGHVFRQSRKRRESLPGSALGSSAAAAGRRPAATAARQESRSLIQYDGLVDFVVVGEAEEAQDAVHAGPAQRVGAQLHQDALPRHFHAGGNRHAHRTHRIPRSGSNFLNF